MKGVMRQSMVIRKNVKKLFLVYIGQEQVKMHTYPGSFPKETTESVIRDYVGKWEYKKIR